jgi:hypothetical protein
VCDKEILEHSLTKQVRASTPLDGSLRIHPHRTRVHLSLSPSRTETAARRWKVHAARATVATGWTPRTARSVHASCCSLRKARVRADVVRRVVCAARCTLNAGGARVHPHGHLLAAIGAALVVVDGGRSQRPGRDEHRRVPLLPKAAARRPIEVPIDGLSSGV